MLSHIKWLSALFMLLLLSLKAYSAIDAHTFNNDVERQRYQSFIEELRCPKCQNQNLAGSDSPISNDLRRELYEMIKLGKSDQEIVDFMVSRYGEFILYRPRISPVTYVLWGAPTVLLLMGLIGLMLMLRQRRRLALEQPKAELSTDDQERLHLLLNGVQKDSLKNDNLKNNKSKKNKGSQ